MSIFKEFPNVAEFRDYVHSFYGKDAIYDLDVSIPQIEDAIVEYLKLVVSPKNHFEWGYGDSLDRERVRDILMKDYHIMKMMSEAA